MRELIKYILKEDNLKKDLKKVIEYDNIFQAADLVGGMNNLKRIFKDDSEISSLFENLTGTITFYHYLGHYMGKDKHMEFPLQYEIIGRKSNIHNTNHWPKMNVFYDENKLTPEENDTFKRMIKHLNGEAQHSDFDSKKFGNYKLFNVNYFTVKEINGEDIDSIDNNYKFNKENTKNIHNKLYGKDPINESVTEYKKFDKGVNLALKMLSKKYDFIDGWELADPVDKYKYTVFINLFVSLEKVKKYYGIDISDSYKRISDHIYNTEYSKAYPFSALDYEKVLEDPYKINKKLTSTFEEIYDDLPDHLKMERTDENRSYDVKDVKIDGYKYVI